MSEGTDLRISSLKSAYSMAKERAICKRLQNKLLRNIQKQKHKQTSCTVLRSTSIIIWIELTEEVILYRRNLFIRYPVSGRSRVTKRSHIIAGYLFLFGLAPLSQSSLSGGQNYNQNAIMALESHLRYKWNVRTRKTWLFYVYHTHMFAKGREYEIISSFYVWHRPVRNCLLSNHLLVMVS